MDDWCCHPDPFTKKLLPRPEDCLLGDTYILLARDGSCEQTLAQDVCPVDSEDAQDPKAKPPVLLPCSWRENKDIKAVFSVFYKPQMFTQATKKRSKCFSFFQSKAIIGFGVAQSVCHVDKLCCSALSSIEP